MKKLLIILACAATPVSLCAEQWQVLGTRPMGMGGAFVAVAQGPIAQYWNPGGLVKSSANVSGMELPVGVVAEFTGNMLKDASQIGDMADSYKATQQAQQNGTAINSDQLASYVKTLALVGDMNKPGRGALVEVAGGANFKFSKVALSVNNFTSIGLNPYIDVGGLGLSNIGGMNGVKFTNYSSVGCTTSDPACAGAITNLDSALNRLGAGNVMALVCGPDGCNSASGVGAITDTTQLATAIVNYVYATNPGNAPTVLSNATSEIIRNSLEAKPLIAQAAGGTRSYAGNTSRIDVTGASFTEIAAGYAWSVDKWLKGLSLGANLKLINGRTAQTRFYFMSEANTGDAFTMKDTKASWQPAVDLGFLWDVNKKYPKLPLHPRVGLVVRNINSPEFDNPAGSMESKTQLDRQARIGLALNPAKFWTLAVDMDVTKNKTAVHGFDSREVAVGTEINIVNRKAFNIPLRGGIIKNMAETDSKPAYTLGTGLNLLFMHFDVAGLVSTTKTEIDGKKYPTKVGVSASFGLLF